MRPSLPPQSHAIACGPTNSPCATPPPTLACCLFNDTGCLLGSDTVCQSVVLEAALPHLCSLGRSMGEQAHLWPPRQNTELSGNEGACFPFSHWGAASMWTLRLSICHHERESRHIFVHMCQWPLCSPRR